jgi:anthranilate synthase/aminodeoxychorismate synthase-like glutamine amidotransferase
MRSGLKVLLIDHRDSFTCNIKAWLESRFEVSLRLYSKVNEADLKNFNLVVISPGPNSPQDYPHTLQLLKNIDLKQPVLGICLGMQMMNVVEGGTVHPYSPPLHGKTSLLQSKISFLHNLRVARYHSLQCKLSSDFETLATSDDGIAMITKHKNKNWLAFQFHPESFMTENGSEFLNYVVSELLQGSV